MRSIICTLSVVVGVIGCGEDETPVGPIEGPTPNFDGRVMGLVRGADGSADGVPLPNAQVYLVTTDGRSNGEAVTTDAVGRYELPPHPLGSYQVCAERAGFERTCDSEAFEITESSPYVVRNLRMTPIGPAIVGRVELADGSPCARTSFAFDTHLRAVVGLAQPGSTPPGSTELLVSVETDTRGRYFLADLPDAGDYELVARCEEADVTMAWTVSASDGVREAVLTVDNHAPLAGALAFETMTGDPVRRPAPGQQVRVVLHATDENSDPLTYRFIDGHGTVLPSDGARATLEVPDRSAQLLLMAEVSDGRGGYAESRQMLRTDPRSFIAGRVLEAEGMTPIAGASVTLAEAVTTSDAEGLFRFETMEPPPYPIEVEGDGFVGRRLVLEEATTELRAILQPRTRHTVATNAEHTLQDDRGFASVHLPRGSIPGGRVMPMVNVDVTGYDPRRPADFPGGETAEIDGEVVPVELFAAMDIEITSPLGEAVELTPRYTAELTFPALPAVDGVDPPEEVLLLSLDEARQVWVSEGTAVREGSVYRGRVSHFSQWSVAQELREAEACIRVDVAPELLGQFLLRVVGTQNAVLGEWVPTQNINVVRNLQPLKTYEFHIASLTDPAKIYWGLTGRSLGPINPPLQWPYISGTDGCNDWLQIEPELPTSWWLNRIYNSAEEALEYYEMIGYDSSLTLDAWKAQWGFTAGDEADALAFYNPQEFGLGRRAVCHSRGSTPEDLEMACCVAKFGHVGGPVHEALEDTIHDANVGDTVCMEWGPGPAGGEPFARFLAFTADGNLTPTTVFDTSGAKSVPGVCGHCHGRTQDWRENGGDTGGRFVFFDAPAYEYATWAPEWTKAAQEERFRELNRLVRMTHDGEGPYADYIDSLYSAGVDTPGATSSEPDPLPGWATDPLTYGSVIRPNCRTCHIWQGSPFDLAAPDPNIAPYIEDYVCEGIMPNAMQPTLNLWQRLEPFLGDSVTSAFGAEACFSQDNPPTVQIVSPANGSSHPLGGFFALRLQATANDVEDGPGCCTITWASNHDGVIGSGRDLYTSLRSSGVHTITATARDSRYRIGMATVQVTATNSPPAPEILFPERDFDPLYKGIPYILNGRATDVNEPLGLPCDRLEWSGGFSGDALPVVGCHPQMTFSTNGQRTLRLTATDSAGASVTVTRTVNVPDPPLNSPPIVTVLSPLPGASYPAGSPFSVRVSVVDPDERGTITWEIRARRVVGGSWIAIDSGTCAAGATCQPTFDWTPADTLGTRCGGYEAEVLLEAMDDDGLGQGAVVFYASSPPC